MNNFKLGDKVIGLPSANSDYHITKEGWIGTVENIDKKGQIFVDGKGCKAWVDAKDFELLDKDKKTPITKTEEAELTLPPEIKKRLIKKMPELIKNEYITDDFVITEKGQKALLKILKLL